MAPITEKDYFVRGCTALLDALGSTIQRISAAREPAEQVIFVITTDGLENASREYSYRKVKALVEQKKAGGWEFLFFGANIDAIAAAGSVGIRPDRAVNYRPDGAGTRLNYQVAGEAVSQLRAGRPMGGQLEGGGGRDFLGRKPRRNHRGGERRKERPLRPFPLKKWACCRIIMSTESTAMRLICAAYAAQSPKEAVCHAPDHLPGQENEGRYRQLSL